MGKMTFRGLDVQVFEGHPLKVPKGHLYHIRTDKESNPATIETRVFLDHYGVMVAPEMLTLGDISRIDLSTQEREAIASACHKN